MEDGRGRDVMRQGGREGERQGRKKREGEGGRVEAVKKEEEEKGPWRFASRVLPGSRFAIR